MKNEWLHTGAFNTPYSRRALQQRLAWLEQRIRRLPITPDQLGIQDDLDDLRHNVQNQNLHGYVDEALFDIVENEIGAWEQDLERCPYLPPDSTVSNGRLELGSALDDVPVKISIGSGPNSIQHVALAGAVNSGKTMTLASLACSASQCANVILIDSQNSFSSLPCLRERFEFVSIEQCRFNPFDPIDGLGFDCQAQIILRGFSECYGMIYGELEAYEVAQELHSKEGHVDIVSLRDTLRAKKYKPGSNKPRYRDTADLNLSYLLGGTSLFDCHIGMPILDVVSRGNVILQLHNIVDVHRSFIIRSILDHIFMLRLAGTYLEKPLLLCIDEAQTLIERGDLSNQLLTLRHSKVHVCLNVQNPHLVPPKAMGACDCLLIHSLYDERDKRAIAQQANLKGQQREYLSTLEHREVVCFLPRSETTWPFLIQIAHVEKDNIVDVPAASFIQDLAWTPRAESAGGIAGKNMPSDKEERFLRDCLIQEHEFSALTARFERAGIRSASTQGSIIKSLISKGYINIEPLAIGKGRPIKLCEPTAKALEEFGVTWTKTRGKLTTRAATEFMYRKLKKLSGGQVTREGALG